MNRSMRSAPGFARRTLWHCLALACALGTAPLSAQIPDSAQIASGGDTVYEVRLEDGSVLFGRIVAVAGLRVVMVTQGGVRLELQRAQIREAQPLRGTVQPDGEV